MVIKDYIGSEFIGQEDIKRKINFFIEGYHASGGFMPPMFFVGQKGVGKTSLVRLISKSLLSDDGLPKKFIEVNGSSLKKLSNFIDEIVLPHIVGDQRVSVFVDEIATADQSVLDWLLSVLEVNNTDRTKAFYNGVQYDFSFKHLSFFAGSTDIQKISLPLRSRFRRFDFSDYTNDDLCKILAKNLKSSGVSLKDGVENEIVGISRGCPREIVFLAKDIRQYLAQEKKGIFDGKDWPIFRKIMGIHPMGLNNSEIRVLEYLNSNGPSTLTCLGASLGLAPSAIRTDCELMLLSKGLIKINVQRHLTPKGLDILKEIHALKSQAS